MKLSKQKLLKWGFLTFGIFCLVIGFALIGQWVLLALAGLAWLAGVLAVGWFAVIFMSIVGLAAVGVCVGAWPPLMILGATLALASWDLANWEDFVASGLPAGTVVRFEWRHYAYLTFALGAGMLAAIIGRLVSFQLPFGILAVLAILALLGLNQVWRFIIGRIPSETTHR